MKSLRTWRASADAVTDVARVPPAVGTCDSNNFTSNSCTDLGEHKFRQVSHSISRSRMVLMILNSKSIQTDREAASCPSRTSAGELPFANAESNELYISCLIKISPNTSSK